MVTAWQQPEALAVLREVAKEQDAPFRAVDLSILSPGPFSLHGQQFSFGGLQDLSIRLLGRYQMENAALVLTAVELLRAEGLAISETAVRSGLSKALWPGRFELAATAPTVIVDGGHNAQGAHALADNLDRYFPGQRIVLVMGILADKDLPAITAPVLPLAKQFFTFTPNSSRAMEATVLARHLTAEGALAEAVEGGAAPALTKAKEAAGPAGVVCYFGSLYSVSEAREALGLWP